MNCGARAICVPATRCCRSCIVVLEVEAAIAFKISAAIAQTHVLRARVAVGVEGKLEAVQVVLARYVPP